MAIQMIIFLFGLVSQVLCDPDLFTYTEDCKPPNGFTNNDTGLSTTTPEYITLRPIERCCPQCGECKHLGGFCSLKWPVQLYKKCCDFTPVEPCKDYSCLCCIICGDDKCSPCVETGGNCRKECRTGELEDTTNHCSYYNNGTGCKCCKKCQPTSECTDAQGICVTNPDDCPLGTFASTGCCGGCYCCKPVPVPVPGSNCMVSGGYCSETDECANGYYACFGECIKTLFTAGLKSTVLSFCCIPKQTGPVVPGPVGRIDQQAFMMDQAFALQQQQEQHQQQQHSRRHPRQLLE